MLDFPSSSLSVGQKYPVTPVAGVPQYTWDGEKWTTVGSGSTTTAPPAAALPLMNATPAVVGVTTKYAREDHVHPTDTSLASLTQAVRYDAAQALTAPQQVQARQNVYAAPFDALAYSGMQINGSMEVSQAKGTTSVALVSGGGMYVLDGWAAGYSNAGATFVAGQISLGGPVASGVYFPNAFGLTANPAMTTVAAGDFIYVLQGIEGYRISRLGWGQGAGAQPLTVGFWIYATAGGTATVSAHNAANDRSYVIEVIIAAGVWQYKTITIPGCIDGTWNNNAASALVLYFTFACGTTYQTTTPNAWVTTNKLGTAAGTNFFATAGNNVYLTGVVVLPGLEAPSAARSALIMRPYDQELLTCQRYYEKSFDPGVPPANNLIAMNGVATAFSANVMRTEWTTYRVIKRSVATITFFSDSNTASPTAGQWSYYNGGSGGWFSGTAIGAVFTSTSGFQASFNGTGAANGSYLFSGNWVADARL